MFLWILINSSTILIKLSLIDFITQFQKRNANVTRVAIYGAGEAGALLASSLNFLGGYRIKTFLDDNSNLWSRNINGIPIKAPQALANLTEEIDQILLAIPSLKYNEKKNILNSLSNYPFKVLQIPSIKNITSRKEPIQNLNPITAKDILSREVELTLTTPKSINFVDYSILITGAGGSIGSEICRQILELKPKKLILLERSEPSLYQITNEIYEKNINNIEVIPILGDAKDSNFINSVFSKYKIDSIFHAAAYKHVPLVESNPLQGLSNNILSTKIICQNALKYSVKKVTLISSDKAVRPANIMGASKD